MKRIELDTGDSRIAVRGVLDFDSVAALLKQPLSWPAGDDVHIDLAGVSHSNSAGLALLLEWLKNAQQKGRQIKYHNVPEQLLTIARAYGIDDDLPIATADTAP